ncbi:MAG: YigZ family protein [bacterium]|nr:YigZ family protein [bacterium]
MSATGYRTVLGEFRFEGEKIKGSRFIATLIPLREAAALGSILEPLRAEFPEANHHCWAYRLGTGRDTFRYSDDGEPSGTAGKPILQRIDGHSLTDLVVVVSRIFGGTKLGAGGLIRAYGGAAGAALDRVEIREVLPVRRVTLTFPYDLSGAVRGVLVAAGLEPSASAFGETVSMDLEIPEDRADGFLAQLAEKTAGRVAIGDGADDGV